MAGGIWDPKKRRRWVAIIAIILVIALVVPTVLSAIMGLF